MKHLITALAAMAVMTACNNEQKILVLYYSQTGATKSVAESFSTQLGADICSFDVEEAYDGDFNQTIARCQQEQASGFVPTLKPLDKKIADYDVIFLGYPVWFGTYAPPVAALLQNEQFNGKTIVPFCTFGSGGLNTSSADLKKALPGARIAEGYGVRNARIAKAPAEITRFLTANGYKDGESIDLPEYSQQQPVTETQTALFNQACSDYQFPLGIPQTCGTRETPWGTEYLFKVGNGSTIYVTVTDGQAEFTEVVR